MRKIAPSQILTFLLLLLLILILGIGSTWLLLGTIPLGDFRGVVLVSAAILLVYSYAVVVYRLFLAIMPLLECEEMPAGSKQEFAAQVNILFYLLLFNSLIRTHFIPVPLLRLVYIALGAHLGRNTYSAGVILDPPLTSIGDNCIIGHDAVLFSHAIEGNQFSLRAIRIGNNVTIGATAVIMSGVTIGDDAIVSAGAVVTKGTCIGAREIWGGVPAKLLKRRET
jgi:acetyltransferase-like isoleucine patch superfamily enzyme